ncbi:MAG: hypothetical protein ACRELB_00100 [Polyangiaceae bacterium]
MEARLRAALAMMAVVLAAAVAGCESSSSAPAANAGAAPDVGPIEIHAEYEMGGGDGLLAIPDDIVDRVVATGAWRAGGATATAKMVKDAFDECCVYADFTTSGGARGLEVRDPALTVVMREDADPARLALVKEGVEGARFEKLAGGYRFRFRCTLAIGGGERPARFRCDVDARGEVIDPKKPDRRRFRATWVGPLAPDAPTSTAMLGG